LQKINITTIAENGVVWSIAYTCKNKIMSADDELENLGHCISYADRLEGYNSSSNSAG
jgi:hypothetical protein